MNSARTLWILMSLILVLILGLRRFQGPADSLDLADADDRSLTGSPPPSLSEPGLGRRIRWGRIPMTGTRGGEWVSADVSNASDLPETGSTPQDPAVTMDSADLDPLVLALEAAPTPEEQGLWADRIAAEGGANAVETLVRLSLTRSRPEQAEALREAFKGFATEEEMGALATSLVQIEDHDLIEAVVETLARGARPSTVEQLIRLHEESSTPTFGRTALGWAIERIRNPEAAPALAELARRTDRPDLADAGIIAWSALRAEAGQVLQQESP